MRSHTLAWHKYHAFGNELPEFILEPDELPVTRNQICTYFAFTRQRKGRIAFRSLNRACACAMSYGRNCDIPQIQSFGS